MKSWQAALMAMAARCLSLIPSGCLLLVALLGGSQPAAAQSISGPAEIIDGDTLSLTGIRVRLFGIDAPEARQTCILDGAEWACGDAARTKLEALVGGRSVECSAQDTDRYGRMVAICHAGTVDIGEAMVAAGLATAFTKYSDRYVETETSAKQLGLGLWSSSFDEPATWRAEHSRQEPEALDNTEAASPASPKVYRDGRGRCAIKGNRSRRGDWIYHLPGRPYYEETRPEALFCTEADALAAGYRPSRAR